MLCARQFLDGRLGGREAPARRGDEGRPDRIQHLEDAAAQADKDSAADTKRAISLTGKALQLLGEWSSTREKAAVAAGHAAEAASYAAQEKDTAEYLSEVAANDEAIAQQDEAQYIALEGTYRREQQQAKSHSTTHERRREELKTPVADRGPVVNAATSTPAHIATTADVSSERGEAFFWSGVDEPVATAIAQTLGGNTLEGTLRDRGVDMPDWAGGTDPAVAEAWYTISARYAAAASGEVRVIAPAAVRYDSVWNLIEKPTLINNPEVTEITRIDPVAGDTETLFTR